MMHGENLLLPTFDMGRRIHTGIGSFLLGELWEKITTERMFHFLASQASDFYWGNDVAINNVQRASGRLDISPQRQYISIILRFVTSGATNKFAR